MSSHQSCVTQGHRAPAQPLLCDSVGSSSVFVLVEWGLRLPLAGVLCSGSVAGCLSQPGPCSRGQKPCRVPTEESLWTVDSEVSEP